MREGRAERLRCQPLHDVRDSRGEHGGSITTLLVRQTGAGRFGLGFATSTLEAGPRPIDFAS